MNKDGLLRAGAPHTTNRHVPTFCDTLSFSAGLPRSFKPAATRHHFISGAQKNTVLGPEREVGLLFEQILGQHLPAGWFMKLANFDPVAPAAAPDMITRVVLD